MILISESLGYLHGNDGLSWIVYEESSPIRKDNISVFLRDNWETVQHESHGDLIQPSHFAVDAKDDQESRMIKDETT